MSLFEKFKRKKSNAKKKRLTLTVRDARSGAVESATTTPNHYLDTASSSCESSSYNNDCSGGGSCD